MLPGPTDQGLEQKMVQVCFPLLKLLYALYWISSCGPEGLKLLFICVNWVTMKSESVQVGQDGKGHGNVGVNLFTCWFLPKFVSTRCLKHFVLINHRNTYNCFLKNDILQFQMYFIVLGVVHV